MKSNNQKIEKFPKRNEDITASSIRVIDEEGKVLGIFSKAEAISLAKEKEMDLVEVSPNTQPPVCKICDFGKLRYQAQKKANKNKKNTKIVKLKNINLSFRIDSGDFNNKINQAKKFLNNGDKVKISVKLRGREISRVNEVIEIVQKFIDNLGDMAKVQSPPKLEGKTIGAILEQNHKKL